MLEPDKLLQGRYRVVRSLGSGGMGAVYEVVDEHFGNHVALKEALVTDPKLAKAFEREARLLRTLRHRALPGVIDYFTEGDSWFLVMDYVPGEDFASLAERHGGPFPIADVLGWGDQLLEVLEYLHGHEPPIVHRDVKPQNLKLTPDGRIVLLDFGLSKGFSIDQAALSGHQSIFGYTPHFAPLEQIRGSGTDARSDVYATAATLWSLATGIVAPDALQRAGAVASGEPDPLLPAHEVVAQIPESVSRVFEVALAHSPDERPQSAAVLRRLLRDAAASPSDTHAPHTPPSGAHPVAVNQKSATAAVVHESPPPPAPDANRSPATGATPEPAGSSNRWIVIAIIVIVLIVLGIAIPFMLGKG